MDGIEDHGRLRQLGAAVGQLGANLRGEEALQLPHGGVHDLLSSMCSWQDEGNRGKL